MVQAPEKDGTTLNKFEKFKAEKDGLAIKDELDHFAQIGWEAMDKTDLEHRLKCRYYHSSELTITRYSYRRYS
jgi:ferredoxin-nitrite reductase